MHLVINIVICASSTPAVHDDDRIQNHLLLTHFFQCLLPRSNNQFRDHKMPQASVDVLFSIGHISRCLWKAILAASVSIKLDERYDRELLPSNWR